MVAFGKLRNEGEETMNWLNQCSKAEAEPESPKTLLKQELGWQGGGRAELPAPNRARFQGVF